MSLCKRRQCRRQWQSSPGHGENRAADEREREVTEFLAEFHQSTEPNGSRGFRMGKWSVATFGFWKITQCCNTQTHTHTHYLSITHSHTHIHAQTLKLLYTHRGRHGHKHINTHWAHYRVEPPTECKLSVLVLRFYTWIHGSPTFWGHAGPDVLKCHKNVRLCKQSTCSPVLLKNTLRQPPLMSPHQHFMSARLMVYNTP